MISGAFWVCSTTNRSWLVRETALRQECQARFYGSCLGFNEHLSFESAMLIRTNVFPTPFDTWNYNPTRNPRKVKCGSLADWRTSLKHWQTSDRFQVKCNLQKKSYRKSKGRDMGWRVSCYPDSVWYADSFTSARYSLLKRLCEKYCSINSPRDQGRAQKAAVIMLAV